LNADFVLFELESELSLIWEGQMKSAVTIVTHNASRQNLATNIRDDLFRRPEALKSRVANVYSQGGTTMQEIADLFDLSLEDRELVVRYQGKIA
jgi:hypothetical protein